MRNVVRQRRGKMRQEDGQKARHIVVFVFSHLPLPLPFSLKPRISKRKPRLKLVIVVRASCQACLRCGPSRAAFLRYPPQRQLRHEIPGRYRYSFGIAVSVDINAPQARAVDVDRLRQHTSSHRHGGVKPPKGGSSRCGSR